VFDYHDICVRNVYADLYYRGRHQNVYFVCDECRHYFIFFYGLHFAVNEGPCSQLTKSTTSLASAKKQSRAFLNEEMK